MNQSRRLRELGRHEEAIATLLTHLAHHPEDPAAFLELALNRMDVSGQLGRALEDAKTASGLVPEEWYPLSLQSRILSRLERPKEAMTLAQAALNLEPESIHAWNSKALAHVGLSEWKVAETCCRSALALDADDETASNLLAHVLRMQNRLDDSEAEARRRLARDPENAFSFANAGWAALQRGDVKEAENLFKESLRIDPMMEYAKDGLKQSYRARSAFFRLFLKWSFFMQRLNENHRTAIIIGLVVGFQILKRLAATVDPLLVIPVAVLYYLFVFGSWLSSGLANFFVLKDPIARMSLDTGEKIEGAVIATLFFGGLVGLVAGFGMEIHALAVTGGIMMLTALPASMVFTNPSSRGRAMFGAISAAIILLGAVMVFDVAMNPGREILAGTAGTCSSFVLLLVAASTWIGMMPSMRSTKEQ